jgi:hypothetical protein
MNLAEREVIEPANHAYVWVAFPNEYCSSMVLRIFSLMPQRGSLK